MSRKLNARNTPSLIALAAAITVALPASMVLAAKDDTTLTQQAQARAADLQPAYPASPAPLAAQQDTHPPAPLPMALHQQMSQAPVEQMAVTAQAPRHEGAFETYAMAKLYGERTLKALDRADAALLARDEAGARQAIDAAIDELNRARGLAFRDVISTRSGTVSDLWTPAGYSRDGSADARLGTANLGAIDSGAIKYGGRNARYADYLRQDGAQVLIPVRDTLANLKTALGYVRKHEFDQARSAINGIFDSSVMVATWSRDATMG